MKNIPLFSCACSWAERLLITLSVCLLPPANEVCKGYIFTGVCLSIGETPPPPHPGKTPHPLGRPPRVDTPSPLRSACWDTVNKQAVRIPLECILVCKLRPPSVLFFLTCHVKKFHITSLPKEIQLYNNKFSWRTGPRTSIYGILRSFMTPLSPHLLQCGHFRTTPRRKWKR